MKTNKVGRPATRVDKSTLGGKIRSVRRMKRLSVAAAAAAVGVSASTWYDYERNDRMPSVEKLRAICGLLGSSTAGFLRGVEL